MGRFLEFFEKAKYEKKVDLGMYWEYWYRDPKTGTVKKNKVKKSKKDLNKMGIKDLTVQVKEKPKKNKEEIRPVETNKVDPQDEILDRPRTTFSEQFENAPMKPEKYDLPPGDFTLAHKPEQVAQVLNTFNALIREGQEFLYRSQRIRVDKIQGFDGSNAMVTVSIWNGRKYVARPEGAMLMSQLNDNIAPLSEVRLKNGTVVVAFLEDAPYMGTVIQSLGKKGLYDHYNVEIPDKGTIVLRKDQILPVNAKNIIDQKNKIRSEESAYVQEYQKKIMDEWESAGFEENDRAVFWQKILSPVYMKLDSATSNFYKDIASKRNFWGVDDFFGEESFLLRANGLYERALLNYVTKKDETGQRFPILTPDQLNQLGNEKLREYQNGFLARFGGIFCKNEMDCSFKNATLKSTGKKSEWLKNLSHIMIEKISKVQSFLPMSRNQERVLAFIKATEQEFQDTNGRQPTSAEHFEFLWEKLKSPDMDKKIKANFKNKLKDKKDGWYLFLVLKTSSNMKFENLNDELMDENGNMMSREEIVSEQSIKGRFKYTPQNLVDIKETAKNVRNIVDKLTVGGATIGKKTLSAEHFAYAYKIISGIGEGGKDADESFFFENLTKDQQRQEIAKKTGINFTNKELEAIPAIFVERVQRAENKIIANKLKRELTEYAELNKSNTDKKDDGFEKLSQLFKTIKKLHLRYLWDEMLSF